MMICNKRLLAKLPPALVAAAVEEIKAAVEGGREYTLFSPGGGVAVSTYNTVKEAKGEIRTWSVFPQTTRETIKYNRILKSLGIK